MEYTHYEFCYVFKRSVSVLVELHGNTHYVIVVDVIQTLMCFDDWKNVSVRWKM
jgi:hypothetical protein